MKHLSLKLIFLPLIFLTIIGSLNAQTNCSLPATANLYVISTSINSAEIAWTEVTGAAGYEVETVEVSSGNTVSSQSTTDNTIVITGLQPGMEYDIYVTTQCDSGLPGGTANVRLTTGIVVVDVIIQLNCAPGPGTSTGHNYNSGDSINYNLAHNEVISFDGTVETGANQDTFKLLFKMNANNNSNPPELLASTTADFETRIEFFSTSSNAGLAKVDYRTSGNGNFQTLAYFTAVFGNNPVLEVIWNQEVKVDFTYCDGSGGKGKLNGDQQDAALQVSPNPTNGWFRILAHENSPVLIADMNGQVWHESELFGGEQQELDATHWPNGSYIIRTIEHGEVVNTLLFKTD